MVMGPKLAVLLDVKETEYIPAKMTNHVVDNRSTKVLGMAIVKIMTISSNRTTRQQAHIMEAGDQLYLSHQALRELPENYPEAEVTCEEGNLRQVGEVEEERPCNCQDQALPPDTPMKMSYEGTEENMDKLKEFIVHTCKASAFNVCTHQKLHLDKILPLLRL